MTTTQFWLPVNPELYVETAVSLPAFYIKNRTTGSYVKLGQTYSIVSSKTLDLQPPDVPGEGIPMIPYMATPTDFIPILVDCTKTGIEATATTTHEAGWMVIGDLGIVGGSYTTSDTDRGA